jgi:hypothetical protein
VSALRIVDDAPIRRRWNVLGVIAVVAEITILGATATVAWGLIAGSRNLLVTAPIVLAATAVEATRLPLVLRIPRLGLLAAAAGLTLALALSTLTGETLVLGVESVLTARSAAVTVAETRLSEAQTSFDAAKADDVRRNEERDRLVAAVAAAQKHSEEIGREPVALQNNAAVSAYRGRKGWVAPGSYAAGAVAAANARAQADHARRAAAAETDLAQARAALAAVQPVDITAKEADLVAAKREVERERAASPMHRLAASIFRTDTANLKPEDYAAVRRFVTLSLAALMAGGTLAAGLISALPDRDARKPSKLARALRAMFAARRRSLRRITETVRTEYRDRLVAVPVDKLGRVLNPDLEVKP